MRSFRRTGIGLLAVLTLALGACSSVVDGSPSVQAAANSKLKVVDVDPHSSFDTTVQNALTDIMAFWKTEFPKISGGKPLTPLKGGLYSVNGLKVAETDHLPPGVGNNACAAQNTAFVVDNGAFCTLDDSIAWDRSPTHLFARLAHKYGQLMVAMIFAHEFGHAISYRLGVFQEPGLQTIDTESQADCASGAWVASALKGQDPHFVNVTPQKVDDALEGYLDGRDATPGTPEDVSHGNGFDRLSAVADGIQRGAKYCFSKGYFASRSFTERPYSTKQDSEQGGNTPFAQVLAPSASNEFVKDLNRFWTQAAKSVNKKFAPVKIAEAAHPKCGSTSSTSEFGYCPSDNTVYYNRSFAHEAYYSLPGVDVTQSNGNVTLVNNQPADFALLTLFSVGWGLAVRHQLFHGTMVDSNGLLSAVCYTGSYAKNINIEPDQAHDGQLITLSPSDLDEGTSSMIGQVGKPQAYGNRGTTGLDRIQAFVKGYRGGLSAC